MNFLLQDELPGPEHITVVVDASGCRTTQAASAIRIFKKVQSRFPRPPPPLVFCLLRLLSLPWLSFPAVLTRWCCPRPQVVRTLTSYYPARLARLHIVGLPRLLFLLFQATKPLVHPPTRQKACRLPWFFPTDYPKAHLFASGVPPSALFQLPSLCISAHGLPILSTPSTPSCSTQTAAVPLLAAAVLQNRRSKHPGRPRSF